MTTQLIKHYPLFGCDPELFFEKGGKIVGSERALDNKGLSFEGQLLYVCGGGRIVCDGVQVELNPRPTGCRGNLGNEIRLAFQALQKHLEKLDGISANFSSVIEIDKTELDTLSEKSKALGCAPSLNYYEGHPTIQVDGSVYRKRSAGGHIHLGLDSLMPHRSRLAPLMDVLVGNTCVLVDRDPYAAERRKLYGRAGEHRLPKHGFEYRTLSNFWLKSYPLMSFVFGLSRLASSVLWTTEYPLSGDTNVAFNTADSRWDAETALLQLVDLKSVRDAINRNDKDLARKNFQAVQYFLTEHAKNLVDCSLWAGNLAEFNFFLEVVDEKGLDYWFPEDPMEHWCTPDPKMCHGTGWESFLTNVVKPQKVQATTATTAAAAAAVTAAATKGVLNVPHV